MIAAVAGPGASLREAIAAGLAMHQGGAPAHAEVAEMLGHLSPRARLELLARADELPIGARVRLANGLAARVVALVPELYRYAVAFPAGELVVGAELVTAVEGSAAP